jgi:hypothetical protein
MAGSCWRLLATCSLIFASPIFASLIFVSQIFVTPIFAAPMLLPEQDAATSRSSSLKSVPAPKTSASSYAGPIAPVWVARPTDPPWRYPRPHRDSDFQRLVFRQLIRSAGIIFSGRVTFIGHAASTSRPDPACTTVTFQVENAIRGASPGQDLTIHEWAGLWSSGERYRVGERVLLFLYFPSKLGLTSPVAGPMGKFAMNSQGQVVMSAQHVAILAEDPIVAGKTVVSYADFAEAVRRSMREE